MTLILALDLGQPTLVHRLQRVDFFLVLQIFGIQTLCTLVLLIVDAFFLFVFKLTDLVGMLTLQLANLFASLVAHLELRRPRIVG